MSEISYMYAVPVKYMVVTTWFGITKVIDTSSEGNGKTVDWFIDPLDAYMLCRDMNLEEGYDF